MSDLFKIIRVGTFALHDVINVGIGMGQISQRRHDISCTGSPEPIVNRGAYHKCITGLLATDLPFDRPSIRLSLPSNFFGVPPLNFSSSPHIPIIRSHGSALQGEIGNYFEE